VARTTLWHIAVSHYSEKARWALDHKSVPHVRRAPIPGTHMPIALWLTRGQGKTFPLLDLDGRRIADSSAIIDALEHGWPDPPLYPADPGERERALALQRWFDEEVGPHVRLLAFHELGRDPQRFSDFAVAQLQGPLARAAGAAGAYARTLTRLRYGVDDHGAAELARDRIRSGFDRLEAELDRAGSDHLAGEGFSVADLTAAALFYPLVLPAGSPGFRDMPEPFMEFRASQAGRPGFSWAKRTYEAHRHRAPGTEH
jgi:glutathione S-transferase